MSHSVDVPGDRPSADVVPFRLATEQQLQRLRKQKSEIEFDLLGQILARWLDDDRPRLSGVTPEEFGVPIYSAAVQVLARLEQVGGQPADLMAELAGDGRFRQADIRKTLSRALEEGTENPFGKPADLVRKLREINARFAAQERAAELAEKALDLSVTPQELIGWHTDQCAHLRGIATAGASRFGLSAGDSLEPDLSMPELIRGLLPAAGKTLLFGASNTGKSFAAVDMAFRIAAGMEWHGRRTEPGAVLYLAAENPESIRRRIYGWSIRHQAKIPDRLMVASRPGSLLDRENVAALLDECRRIRAELGEPIRLVVIDTLAMMMPGGDENSAEDMGQAIAACDELAAVTGGMILVIHHAGKDEARGARGWSGLKAAMDVELEATEGKLFVTKNRDGIRHVEFNYEMETVELGANAYGETVTTLVPLHGDTIQKGARKESGPRRKRELPPAARIALNALKTVIAREGRTQPDSSLPPAVPSGVLAVRQPSWKDQFDRGRPEGLKADTHYKQWARGIEYLQAHGVQVKDGWAWIERGRGDDHA